MTLPRFLHRLPATTLLLAVLSLVLSCSPLSEILQYDRNNIAAGQVWLLVTGHLSHWNTDNLFWDLLVFLVLGSLVEQRSRRLFRFCLLCSPLLISAALWHLLPEMDRYRGLSGVDSALFTCLGTVMIQERLAERDLRGCSFIILAAVAFLTKIVYETLTMQAVFSSTDGLFIPVPLAHLSGGATGIASALLVRRERKESEEYGRTEQTGCKQSTLP